MLKRVGFIMIFAAGLGVVGRPALGQFPPVTDPNKDEAKCEKGTGKALVKFSGAKAKCISKCMVAQRKTSGPYAGCFPPFADPATNACVMDPVKGAEAKARTSIVKACTNDCPECYAASVCSTGEPVVSNTEAQLDPFGGIVWCTEAGAATPSKEVAKCEDGVSKGLVKFIKGKSKCYEKCNDNMLKGKIAPGSCDPPTPSDPATAACIFDPVKGAEAKAAAAIDKVCATVGANPACYGTALDTGAEWVAVVEMALDAQIPTTACGG